MRTMVDESSRHHYLEKILQGKSGEPCNLPLQMLRDITNNFSNKQELGRGGFGVVYKGVLRNGHVIAVKKFFSRTGIEEKQFENEINHLMTLQHNNIVRCVGYCYDIQKKCFKIDGKYRFVEDSEMLLCLEYLPEGSLEKYISDGYCGLDWQVRYKIIVGICHGLYYLHDNHTLHLDIKPANILLDYDMEPKITDFGLSRLLDPEQSRIYTKECAGTLGYMAPEYLDKGLISIKSDIFSVGVVIIEIIVGNKDYPDSTGTSTQDFVEQVLQNWRNRLEELRSTSLEKYSQQIKMCTEIGLSCVHPDRVKRPTIREIMERLNRCDNTDFHVSNEERTPVDMVHKKQANIPKGAQCISSLENRRRTQTRLVKTDPNGMVLDLVKSSATIESIKRLHELRPSADQTKTVQEMRGPPRRVNDNQPTYMDNSRHGPRRAPIESFVVVLFFLMQS
ncbi:hypothetical protein EJB05_29346 [Eragrostis curvula]|uniref:Protein kinase domain-containing protein n=1 Tax=Eragrostis curvula TaxID=38414 RepID=A0A5J9USP3_9POAL|nr:hypothetical protein EJB05_29346 [Eragrostis curvula]